MKERIELTVGGIVSAALLAALIWTDAPAPLVWSFAVLTGGLGMSTAYLVGQLIVYREVNADLRDEAARAKGWQG